MGEQILSETLYFDKPREKSKRQAIVFTTRNIKQIFSAIPRDVSVKVRVGSTAIGVCCVYIIKEVLEKEMITYELDFTKHSEQSTVCELVTFEKTYILKMQVMECIGSTHLAVISILYNYLKAINFINEKTFWPILILFDFYKLQNFLHTSCDFCENFENEIFQAVVLYKKLLPSFSSEHILPFSFLYYSDLFTAIYTNLEIVLRRKLYRKNGKEKIYMLLAQNGISITAAAEKYINLNRDQRGIIMNMFGTNLFLIKKEKFLPPIRPIEHFFVIQDFLHSNNPISALLSLEQHYEHFHQRSSLEFYNEFFDIFLCLLKDYKKTGNILLFSFKQNKRFVLCDDSYNEQSFSTANTNILHVFHYFLLIFIDCKFQDKVYIPLLSVEVENTCFLYSEILVLSKIKDEFSDPNIKYNENCVEIPQNLFFEILQFFSTFNK